MALDIAGISGGLWGMLSSAIFWIAIMVFACIGIYFGFRLRLKRKLRYPCYILVDLGKGKIGIRKTLAGWFRTRWFLKIFDYGGEEKCLTKDRREIINVSSKDFHEIDGRRGVICYEKSNDPRILVPISRMIVDNYELVMEIAPQDYRDASVQIVKHDEQETLSTLDKVLPYIAFGVLGIILMICIIVIVQYNKHAIAEAKDMVLNGCKNYPVQSGGTSLPPGSNAP